MQKTLKLISLIFLISTYPIYAQITIGEDEKPVPGALLQLKNKKEVLDASANSTKGLMLPRVYLNGVSSLSPLDVDNNENHNKYIGTVVYNVNNKCSNINWNNDRSNIFKEGIFVWTGDQWNLFEDITLDSKIGSVKDAEDNAYTTMDYGVAGVWMLENLRSKKYDTEAVVDPTFQTLFDSTPVGFAYTTNAPRWAYPGIAGGDGTDSKYFEMDQSLGLLYNIPAVFGVKGSLHATHNIQGLCPNGWKIPSFNDYQLLYNVINTNPTEYTTSNVVGVENLVSTCNIIELGGSILEKGRSKDSYLGGFALKQYSVLHGEEHTYPNGILSDYNFGILRPGDTQSAYPALCFTGICPTVPTRQSLLLINYVPTSSIPPIWEGYFRENETMTGVRCKKR